MPENVIEQALDQVADRAAIDWDALERSLNSADERRWLDCVRVLEDIAKFHFSDGEDGEPAPARAGVADALTIDAGRGAVATPVDISQWWGRYRLDQKVGEGAFGCVYRAWDPELERQVAVKILHKRVAETRLRQALLREGRALARVRDPNVVSVLGVESHEDQIGAVHGIRVRRDARRRVGSRAAERGRGDADLSGRVPRGRRGASRRVRAPGCEGAQRDAREGRPDRPDGLRGRPGYQPARRSRQGADRGNTVVHGAGGARRRIAVGNQRRLQRRRAPVSPGHRGISGGGTDARRYPLCAHAGTPAPLERAPARTTGDIRPSGRQGTRLRSDSPLCQCRAVPRGAGRPHGRGEEGRDGGDGVAAGARRDRGARRAAGRARGRLHPLARVQPRAGTIGVRP